MLESVIGTRDGRLSRLVAKTKVGDNDSERLEAFTGGWRVVSGLVLAGGRSVMQHLAGSLRVCAYRTELFTTFAQWIV